MIPKFNDYGYLPPGEPHKATWDEFVGRFGGTAKRRALLEGLAEVLSSLKQAGCRKVYIDGSLITDKPEPADWDACWEIDQVDFNKLDSLIIDEDLQPTKRKEKYLGDLFLQTPRLPGRDFVKFFQTDRQGNKKGIVVMDLGTLP